MTYYSVKKNTVLIVVLAAFLACALFLTTLTAGSGMSAKAEQGPADGKHTAEITLVSKDKEDLKFIYLSGIILNTDVKGITYDKTTNTLTFKNVELSKDNTHYSLTITNMGEDFKLNVVGTNSLDYLSLESIGYNTGCTITGPGTLDIGYLDISSDGSAMNVTIDNTVTFSADSAKMGYETLPAVKVSSKIHDQSAWQDQRPAGLRRNAFHHVLCLRDDHQQDPGHTDPRCQAGHRRQVGLLCQR